MAQYVKMGPHAGVGGDRTGIGDYMFRLDRARIPFSVKSVADVGLALEAGRYALASGVLHNILLRFPNPGGRGDDHPDLSLPPDLAAREIQDAVLRSLGLAPEFEEVRQVVRVQPTNEISTIDNDPSWIGWFLYYLTRGLNEEGIAVAAGGFNVGQPNAEDWLTEGMARFLTYVSENRQNTVSLHEGKIDPEGKLTIWDPVEEFVSRGTVGRFEDLLRACDRLGIQRVQIDIDEWSWSYREIPDRETVLRDLRWLGAYLAQFPEVLSADLWTFHGGPQWGSLPWEINYLINPEKGAPLTEMALATTYPDPDPRPPSPPEDGCRGRPREQYRRVYQLLHGTVSEEDGLRVFRAGRGERRTTGRSWDDAGIGDLDRREVHFYGVPEDRRAEAIEWFNEHYPGVSVAFRDVPD